MNRTLCAVGFAAQLTPTGNWGEAQVSATGRVLIRAAGSCRRPGMPDFLRRYERETYALFRIVVGFLFLWHGVQKVFGFPPDERLAGAPAFIIWTAGPIELVGGALVMVGLATRWAAFLCSGLMAFAYWMAHGFNALLPLVNQGELAALYCFAFLWIAAHGPGMWSLERTE